MVIWDVDNLKNNTVGWWIGFKVLDEEVWEKVKDGTYSMFSIEGTAERVEADDETDI